MSDISLTTLQDTLDAVECEWADLLRSSCNPLDVVTPMLGSHGLHEWQTFQNTKQRLQKDIQRAVNQHYKTFNASVEAYGIAGDSLNRSQKSLAEIKQQLNEVGEIMGKKPDLVNDLNEKALKYSSMIEVLEQIQTMNIKVGELEECVANRDFNNSIDLFKEIKDMGNSWGVSNLECLQNLYSRLNFCSNSLLESAVDDITVLIYSNDQFKFEDHGKGLTIFLESIVAEENNDKFSIETQTMKFNELQDRLEAVIKLGRDAELLKMINNRTDKELEKLIKKSIDEIKVKYPSQIELQASTSDNSNNLGVIHGLNGTIVHEFFEKIFKRAGLSLQKHIALYELAGINGNTYNLNKVWNVYQKRIGLLMCRYIINEDMFQEAAELTYNTKSNDKTPFKKIPRVFEIGETPILFHFSTLNLSKSNEELTLAISKIFPTQSKEAINKDFNGVNESGIFINVDESHNHKLELLVTPNIFNMGEIIDNFILFTTSIEEFYPIENGFAVKQFFDQFMNIIYTNHLEAVFVYEFEQLCDFTWNSQHFNEASSRFKEFFNKVLSILDTSLHFKEKYVQIVINLLILMKDKYMSLKNELMTSSMPELLKIWCNSSATKSISNEVVDKLLTAISLPISSISNDLDMMKRIDNFQLKELEECLKSKNSVQKISPSSFIPIPALKSTVELIGSLSYTLEWLPLLKRYVPELSSEVNKISQLREIWMLNNESLLYPNTKLFLALNNEHENRFDSVVRSLESLKTDLQLVLRYEIKYESFYCIMKLLSECDAAAHLSTRAGNLGASGMLAKSNFIDEEVSPCIDDFCDRVSNISRAFDDLNLANGPEEVGKVWIFGGIGFWIDRLIIKEAIIIRAMVKGGWVKLMVNLRVLQQLVRKVDFGAELLLAWRQSVLARSLKYFSLGAEGDQLANKVHQMNLKSWGFTKEEYYTLVRLMYGDRGEDKKKLLLNRIVG